MKESTSLHPSMKNIRLFYVYLMSTLGDLSDSLLLVGCVLYATQLGASATDIGWIGGAYGLTYLFTPVVLGRIGDRIPRKISLLIATTGSFCIPVYLLLFTRSPLDLFLGRLILGILYGFHWPNIEAFISENMEHTDKGHRQGMTNFCIAWGIGYMTGPYLAAVLFDINIHAIFLCAIIFYAIEAGIVLFGIPLSPTKPRIQDSKLETQLIEKDRNESKGSEKADYSAMRQVAAILMLGVAIYSIIVKVILTYFPYYAVISTGLNWSGELLGEVLLFFGIGRLGYFLIGRWLPSRYSVITGAFMILGLISLSLLAISNAGIISGLFLVFGFCVGMIYLSSLDLMLKYEQHGKAGKAGLFESMIGFGTVVAPIVAGLLAKFSLILPFLVFGTLAIVQFGMNLLFSKYVRALK
jgi:MFS family permease